MAPAIRDCPTNSRATTKVENQNPRQEDGIVQPTQPEIHTPTDVVTRMEMDMMVKQMEDRFQASQQEMNNTMQQSLRL